MNRRTPLIAAPVAAIGLLLSGCASTAVQPVSAALQEPPAAALRVDASRPGLVYPATRTVDQVDDYHGTLVADPYRWLEELDSPEVRAWAAAQNALTAGYRGGLPRRAAIERRLSELSSLPSAGLPTREGARTFWLEHDGVQDQAVLYVRDALGAEPRVLLDPNTFSGDGTVSLSTWAVAPGGELLAYGVRVGGSDWQTFHVRDVDTGRDLADTLRWVKFSSIIWTADDGGFFYSRYDEPEGDALFSPNREHQLFYHRVGTPQSADRLILRGEEHPHATLGAQVTEDGRHLLVHEFLTRRNRTFVLDLGDPLDPDVRGPLVPLFAGFDASYEMLGSNGSTLFVLTDDGAPLRRIIAVDLRDPARERWRTIVPESAAALDHADLVGDRFVVNYLEDVKSVVRFFSLAGEPLGTLDLPGIGSARVGPTRGMGGRRGRSGDTDFYYHFESFLEPGAIYRYDLAAGRSTPHSTPELPFDTRPYTTEQVFYTSTDGTHVPMFIVRRTDAPLDGSNPVLLHGYGGFRASWPPEYDPLASAWLELGGIWAVANLRGGGEYGRAWHEAGMFDKKQNVFDDFVAAAEYLIAEGFTRPEKLAIMGTSMGGLLVGAVMTQRPDLFAAAIPRVGLFDMLRYHTFVGGQFGLSEFGSSDDPEGFRSLYAYSPLHNVRAGTCYPATLVATADREDRVPPLHSYKFVAALQAAQACASPVLLRVETDAGHGPGTSASKRIAESADMLAFVAETVGVDAGGRP